MNAKWIQINQLQARVKNFANALELPNPPTGWIRAVRLALGMSLQQLAKKLYMTKQSVQDMEMREKEGSITIRSLREAAEALDMELVYGFVPKSGSMDKLIEKKSRQLATEIVHRTSQSMKLENQENSKERIKNAIEERVSMLKIELPKELWD